MIQYRYRRHLSMAFSIFLLAAGVTLAAQITNVLNPASDLAGKTLVTAEGSRSISGTLTFTVAQRFTAGTSGNPGITLGADTSTGMQLGVGTVGLSLSGTQRALLDANGLTIYGNNIINNTGKIPALTSTYLASLDGSALTNITTVPSGAIFFFNAACPTGYTEFTDARGRYIVGLVSGGTLDTGVGTALTNQENRPAGSHNHAITDPGHFHSFTTWTQTNEFMTNGAGAIPTTPSGPNTGSAVTGITISAGGGGTAGQTGTTGTNAPYIQLRTCQKT